MKSSMFRSDLACTSIACGLVVVAASLVLPAHAQWIDAGGQANLMHQQELLRNQTTGEGNDARETAMQAEITRAYERRKSELRPEYLRRVRLDGKPTADAWLRRTSAELAKRDNAAIRERYRRR